MPLSKFSFITFIKGARQLDKSFCSIHCQLYLMQAIFMKRCCLHFSWEAQQIVGQKILNCHLNKTGAELSRPLFTLVCKYCARQSLKYFECNIKNERIILLFVFIIKCMRINIFKPSEICWRKKKTTAESNINVLMRQLKWWECHATVPATRVDRRQGRGDRGRATGDRRRMLICHMHS